MKNLLAFIFALAALLLPDLARAEDEKPLRALLICGGCCHDYTHQKDILTQGISARANVEWTILQEGDNREHKHSVYSKPEWWKGYDVIVHDECFGYVDDVDFVESIVKAQAAGVPAVALHCSLHSYRKADSTTWAQMLGIKSNAHGKPSPIAITFTDKDNPITKGMADWTTVKEEELYNNIKIYDTATPLAHGKQGEDDTVVIWTNNYKGTRVFCTTLGHSNAVVGDERYLDLVTRGLLWSVNKLDEQHFHAAKATTQRAATDSKSP